MEWNYRKIRRTAVDTVFGKGFRAWLLLTAVGFLFAFIGASNATQTTFIDIIDEWIGAHDPKLPHNLEILKDYLMNSQLVRDVPFITTELVTALLESAARGATWALRLLAANIAYFQRNHGEVVVMLFLSAILAAAARLLVQNVIIIGRNRWVMENRFTKNVSKRRIFAPFHKSTLPNVIKVMLIYRLTVALWSLTVIGGIYKLYQYSMVPYLLAENPAITWKQARTLSKQMTDGYKWKIFLTEMSFLPVWLLKLIPVAGLLLSVPLEMQLQAEFYFALRPRCGADCPLLTEPAFAAAPYVERPAEPAFTLRDLSLRPNFHPELRKEYAWTHYIFIFFSFCIVGWIWECVLHIVEDHELVNRGTMYGPWIPIYGVGGTAIILLMSRFKEHKLRLFLLEVLFCGILEYLTSFFLDIIFNTYYWDYTMYPMNVNGRICLYGLIAFGLGGMAGIYLVGPAIAGFADRFSRKQQRIAAGILCTAFAADLICCAIFGFNKGAGVGGQFQPPQ